MIISNAVLADIMVGLPAYKTNYAVFLRRVDTGIFNHFHIRAEPLRVQICKLVEAGVDMFNLSSHYAWEQDTDLPKIMKMAPTAAVYLEMTQCLAFGPRSTGSRGWRLTTPEMFTTAPIPHASCSNCGS